MSPQLTELTESNALIVLTDTYQAWTRMHQMRPHVITISWKCFFFLQGLDCESLIDWSVPARFLDVPLRVDPFMLEDLILCEVRA